MKKLRVKYERFDLIFKTYKFVRQKDGVVSRFIDLYTEDAILFKDIRAKVKKLFDTENWNYFAEVLHECVTSINDITEQQLHKINVYGTT